MLFEVLSQRPRCSSLLQDLTFGRIFCDPFMDSFIAKYKKLYCAFFLERRKSSESYYVDCNRAIRFARADGGTSGSETSSTLSSVTKWSTSGAALSRVVVPVTSASKKGSEKSKNLQTSRKVVRKTKKRIPRRIKILMSCTE